MAGDHVDGIRERWAVERPGLDTSSMEVVGRVMRIAALLRPELEAVLVRHELGWADFDVLATLRRSGRLTPGQLSRSTMASTGGMTKILDRLEARALVRREPDPNDRRGRLTVLTEEGHELSETLLDQHLRNQERLLKGLPPAKRERLAKLLRDYLLALEGPADG